MKYQLKYKCRQCEAIFVVPPMVGGNDLLEDALLDADNTKYTHPCNGDYADQGLGILIGGFMIHEESEDDAEKS